MKGVLIMAKNNILKRASNTFIFKILVDSYGVFKKGDLMTVDKTTSRKYITEQNNVFYSCFVQHLRNSEIMELLEQY